MKSREKETLKKLIIIGASGHGKVIADIAEKCGYEEIAFLDDNREVRFCMEYPVVGRTNGLELYEGYQFFVAIGNSKIRENFQNRLIRKGMKIATLIHPNAVIASHVFVGAGTVIMAGTVINPGCRIGDGCIINTGSTIDHDNQIGDFVHVSVGSHLAGTVNIGNRTWIGAGAVINNNITICGDCMIGAGAVVVKDIQFPGTYIGIPARRKNMSDRSKCEIPEA